jgi:hypothetical protein
MLEKKPEITISRPEMSRRQVSPRSLVTMPSRPHFAAEYPQPGVAGELRVTFSSDGFD